MLGKYMNVISAAAIVLGAIALTACHSSKKSRYETFEVPATTLHAIEAQQGINVIYEQKEGEPKVSVSCDTIYTPQLDVNVIDGKLHAAFKPGSQVPYDKITVRVTSPAVNSLKAEMGAEIKVSEAMSIMGDVEIEANTAGAVKFPSGIACQKISIRAHNTGKVILKKINADATEVNATTAAYVALEGESKLLAFQKGTTADVLYQTLKTVKADSTIAEEIFELPKPKKEKPAVKDTTRTAPAATAQKPA